MSRRMSSLAREMIPPNVVQVLDLPGNNRCCDCNTHSPDWCSLSFGTLICLDCAGYHRSLGVHITLVKSLTLDTIVDSQLEYLLYGGNDAFRKFRNTALNMDDDVCYTIDALYSEVVILYYREILIAKVEKRKPLNLDEYSVKIAESLEKNSNSSPVSKVMKTINTTPSTWIPDEQTDECMICFKSFTVFFRRHHCRRCGKCVCGYCAPKNNTRPIPEWNLREPVRHCKQCYMSPVINWY